MKDSALQRLAWPALLVVAALLTFGDAEPVIAEESRSYISLAATETNDAYRSGDVKGQVDITSFDLSAVFGLGSGVGLGVKYFDYNADSKPFGTDGTTISGFGPLVGYMHESGLFIDGSYLLNPAKSVKDSGGGSLTYNGDYGYVIDAGKVFEITKGFGVGLQLTESHTSYKKLKDTSGKTTDLSGTWYDQSLYPYLSVFVFF